MSTEPTATEPRLTYARLLVELGELHEAEVQVAEILDARPEELTPFSLFAKIKHMRGELSQAIACWAQIHARSPHNETALMHLGGILHLAQDPEKNAGEFIALGQFQLARKPTAHLELEEAFRLFLARRPDEARAHCTRLEQKYRGKDRDIHKLAAIASAWIADLSGDLDGACETLESLGRERGFEDDTDRILALVRVYERVGSDEKLRAAVNICRYLERRFEKISVQRRLAVLYRRLGEIALADDYDRRYLAAFRRRMHRPTFAEAVQVAAGTFIPLERLRTIRFPSLELGPSPSLRERALASALVDDAVRARQCFLQGGAPLDLKYLANLVALHGDLPRAGAAYLELLARHPSEIEDDAMVGWLLDHLDELPPSAAERFREPRLAGPLREHLEAGLRATPLRAATWRRLAGLLSLQPDGATESDRCAERARALDEAAARDLRPVGRVLAAGVYHFVGKAKGLIHQVWAGRHAAAAGRGGWLPDDQILGNLTSEMRDGVRNTFLAVREYARSKFPERTTDVLDYSYTFKVTKEDEPSGGLSAGLPTALAFLSVFLQKPVPQDVALSGVLISEAHDVLTVRPVGDAEYKVKAAYNRNLRLLVLPLANRAALAQSAQIPAAIVEELVGYAANLDEAVRLVFGEEIFLQPLH